MNITEERIRRSNKQLGELQEETKKLLAGLMSLQESMQKIGNLCAQLAKDATWAFAVSRADERPKKLAVTCYEGEDGNGKISYFFYCDTVDNAHQIIKNSVDSDKINSVRFICRDQNIDYLENRNGEKIDFSADEHS